MATFRRWPLLLAGLAVLTATVAIRHDDTPPGELLAAGITLGALLVGAGIVLVVWRQDHPPDSHDDEGDVDDRP